MPLSPGIKYMLYATFFFALMALLVKMLPRIPAYEIVFFRSVGMLILCGSMLKIAGISPWGNHKQYLLLRGLYGTIALILYFYTLKNLPLANAVTLQYLSPIFSSILAVFILKESPPWTHWVFFTLSFLGVFLIKGFDPRVSLVFLATGMISPVFSALAYNYVRKLKDYDDPLVTVFYFPFVTLLFLGPYTLYYWVTPKGVEWLYLGLIGLVTHFAQINMTRAYQAERLSVVTNLNYLGMFYALGIGHFMFNETMGWLSLLGMLMILSGVILSQIYKSPQNS